jgi:hypothetical protein
MRQKVASAVAETFPRLTKLQSAAAATFLQLQNILSAAAETWITGKTLCFIRHCLYF